MYKTEHEDIEKLSDEVLLVLSIDTPDFFVYLVKRYEDAFLRKALKVLWSQEDAEDVVQETFTKIYLHAGKFRNVEGASFKSWGYTILMNTAFTKYRKSRRETGRVAVLSPEHYEDLPDIIHEDTFGLGLSDSILSIFAKMPEHLSRVLDLHFLKQIPQQEIAEREGVSVGAIKTRVHRAKAEFRELAEQFATNI
jgi:RNA polymerase sigma-70 factor (ECF subfamily)